MKVKIVEVTEKNFEEIPRPVKKEFNCQKCFFWIGERDGKLDLAKQKKGWFKKKTKKYGCLAKLLLWGEKELPIGYIQFGPISEFHTAELFYKERLPIPKRGWCITCLFIHTPYQKRGLGKRLVRNVLADLRRRGIKTVDTYEMKEFWQAVRFEPVFKDEKKQLVIMRRTI